MLIVHVLGTLTSMMLGLLTVDPVGTLGLGKFVDFSTGKTSKELLGKGVVDRLALLALVVLKGLEAGKGCATSQQLVTKGRLVCWLILDLVVGVVRFTCRIVNKCLVESSNG